MEFFKKHFHDVNFEEERGEIKVLCPFHSDTKPSATVNTEKNLFHCWVCDKGYNEEQFMAEVKGITIGQAYKLMGEMSNASLQEWEISHKAELWADEEVLQATENLGLPRQFIDEMNLGLAMLGDKKTLAIPVFFENSLMDVRKYNVLKLKGLAKMSANKGAQSGWVIPYDVWNPSTDTTYLFEGEKDMLLARSLGLNAITLTGGANAKPNEYVLGSFKNRDVIICYDNDEAGRHGVDKVGSAIHGIAKSVGYIDLSKVVKEDKEDFYDYIMKYGGDLFDFLSLDVIEFIPEIKEIEYTTIRQAMKKSEIRRPLRAIVTATSEFDDYYSVPSLIQAVKVQDFSDKDTMAVGDKRYWTLEDKNIQDMLALVEVDAKDRNVIERSYALMGIPKNEKGIKLQNKEDRFVYKSVVADKELEGSTVTIELYSFTRLAVGGQYEIVFKMFPHPNKNQRIVAIAMDIQSLDDISNFQIDKPLLSLLKRDDTIKGRVNTLFESTKHYVAKHMDFNIWLMSDLVFNSIIEFEYGETMRGTLDIFMLGDTQVGKSETTSKLVELYKFGHFISLKTSTTVGLIGGSNKVDGSWANTIGAIPRQHKRLAVLEEFSGAEPQFIKKMTDIRSSGVLRINRASGELISPCVLRMITISNPINDDHGTPRFLNSFPNGVVPIMELIKSAEDVTRYDAFLLTPKKDGRFNPFGMSLQGEAIPKKAYEHKAQWVMSRTKENVIFAHGVQSYIWEKAEYLNNIFECNVPIFGTTTSKKLARFSVALASLILNTDESMENVVVTKEVVDYMVDFLETIYKSDSFKLDAVKEEWESYSKYDDRDVKIMEDIYPANTVMMEFLAKQSKTTRSNLQAISGKSRDEFSIVFNKLVQLKLIRLNMESVYPSEKFRKIYVVMRKTTGQMVGKHDQKNTKIEGV